MFMLNFLRISKNFNTSYEDYPWPKIYSYDENNYKQKNIIIYKFKNFKIYNPNYRLCMYSPSPCTHYLNIQDQINIEDKFGYFFINTN